MLGTVVEMKIGAKLDAVAVLVNFVVLHFLINSQDPLKNEECYSRIADFSLLRKYSRDLG